MHTQRSACRIVGEKGQPERYLFTELGRTIFFQVALSKARAGIERPSRARRHNGAGESPGPPGLSVLNTRPCLIVSVTSLQKDFGAAEISHENNTAHSQRPSTDGTAS